MFDNIREGDVVYFKEHFSDEIKEAVENGVGYSHSMHRMEGQIAIVSRVSRVVNLEEQGGTSFRVRGSDWWYQTCMLEKGLHYPIT